MDFGLNKNLAVVEIATSKTRVELEIPGSLGRSWITCLSYARDGRTVAAGMGTGQILIWNALTGKRIAVIPPYMIPPGSEPYPRADQPLPAPIWALEFIPDGETLLSIAHGAPLRAWSAKTGEERKSSIKVDRPWSLILSGGGNIIGLIDRIGNWRDSDYRFTFYDTKTWRKRSEWTRPHEVGKDIEECSLLPDGRKLAMIEDGARLILLDSSDGRVLQRYPLGKPGSFAELAVSPDGKRIAAAGIGEPLDFGAVDLIATDGVAFQRVRSSP